MQIFTVGAPGADPYIEHKSSSSYSGTLTGVQLTLRRHCCADTDCWLVQ